MGDATLTTSFNENPTQGLRDYPFSRIGPHQFPAFLVPNEPETHPMPDLRTPLPPLASGAEARAFLHRELPELFTAYPELSCAASSPVSPSSIFVRSTGSRSSSSLFILPRGPGGGSGTANTLPIPRSWLPPQQPNRCTIIPSLSQFSPAFLHSYFKFLMAYDPNYFALKDTLGWFLDQPNWSLRFTVVLDPTGPAPPGRIEPCIRCGTYIFLVLDRFPSPSSLNPDLSIPIEIEFYEFQADGQENPQELLYSYFKGNLPDPSQLRWYNRSITLVLEPASLISKCAHLKDCILGTSNSSLVQKENLDFAELMDAFRSYEVPPLSPAPLLKSLPTKAPPPITHITPEPPTPHPFLRNLARQFPPTPIPLPPPPPDSISPLHRRYDIFQRLLQIPHHVSREDSSFGLSYCLPIYLFDYLPNIRPSRFYFDLCQLSTRCSTHYYHMAVEPHRAPPPPPPPSFVLTAKPDFWDHAPITLAFLQAPDSPFKLIPLSDYSTSRFLTIQLPDFLVTNTNTDRKHNVAFQNRDHGPEPEATILFTNVFVTLRADSLQAYLSTAQRFDDYPHPHASKSGGYIEVTRANGDPLPGYAICLGENQAYVAQLLLAGEFEEAIKLIQVVLRTYIADDSYVALALFNPDTRLSLSSPLPHDVDPDDDDYDDDSHFLTCPVTGMRGPSNDFYWCEHEQRDLYYSITYTCDSCSDCFNNLSAPFAQGPGDSRRCPECHAEYLDLTASNDEAREQLEPVL